MTGGSKGKEYVSQKQDPVATPQPVEQMIMASDAAKKKAHKRGRGGQILAGALNRQVLNFGKARVGE